MADHVSQFRSRLWSLLNAVRVAADIAVIVLVYWSIGVFVRRRYRRCRASGETYWLDSPSHTAASGTRPDA